MVTSQYAPVMYKYYVYTSSNNVYNTFTSNNNTEMSRFILHLTSMYK